MDTLWPDVRFGIRQLLKHRGFTLIAALTLALGIGANTAIFSVVYGVLLRPLPYPQPDRLVGLAETFAGTRDEMGVTYREYQFLVERGTAVQALAASTSVGMNLTAGNAADHLRGLRVSADYLRVLGVAPQLGRVFSADEDQPNGPSVVVLSHELWLRRFGGDRSVVGRTVLLDGKPTAVIGVMPAGFESLPAAEAWSTLAQVSGTVGSGENLQVMGRLPGGMTVAQATQRMQVAFADFHVQFKQRGLSSQLKMDLVPYKQVIATDVQTPVKILFGAIGFVLLIACANVASLILGRAATRHRELAVRVALGATRSRIIRQMLTESVLLSFLGGILAIGVAAWTLDGLLALVPATLAGGAEVHLDRWALLFTFGVALAAGVGFGLAPAWLTANADPQAALQAASARTTGSVGQGRLRNVLVIAEIAMALILLSGAGLMIRTFANLIHTDAGFDPRHELSAEIWLTGSRYETPTAIAGFYADLTTRLQALPGVASAAVVEAGLPLERGGNMGVSYNGQPLRGGIDYRTVTPGYFRTLGVAVREGREFVAADDAGGQPVVVVNESFNRQQYLPGRALGQALTIGGNKTPRAIVGVVGDVRSFIGFRAPPTVFLPSAQTPFDFTRVFNGWFPIHVMVRATGDPAPLAGVVTRTIHDADPQIPVGQVQTMDGVLNGSLSLQRFVMVVLGAFAAVAVALAMVGIYGLISWFVVRSTRDIGVRIALGALPRDVMTLVLRRGMALAITGAAIGVAGALALTRLLASLLFGIAPDDPGTLVGVAVLVGAVALAACYFPARRAARVDPIVSLRTE